MQNIRNRPRAKLRIISRSTEPFKDRTEAGYLLAKQLADLRNKGAIVLGIPRGGIVVAKALASKIHADLDIILSRKLGTPGQPELAMGALAEDGKVFLNRDIVRSMALTEEDIAPEEARQTKEIQQRTRLIRSVLPKTKLKNRIVIVTDDGVATGATMQAALWAVRQESPKRIIAAVPVASREALEKLAVDTDEIICLHLPLLFYAVGQFYIQFDQVEDDEILRILKGEVRRRRNRRKDH